MTYPYYSPNLGISVICRAVFLPKNKAILSIKSYFQNLSGKKYILITNSCRTALYLTYSALEKKGEVITSPLTCKVAIDPIIESGSKPVYADISIKDLNIDPTDIDSRINTNTIAVQAIHLGGNACDMEAIIKIAKENSLFLVEDCAQALGATSHGQFCGSFGDVACFSLIKNGYSIGGGILATNNEELFEKARAIQSSFKATSKSLLLYRIARNITDTYRNTLLGKGLFKILIKVRGNARSYQSVFDQLKSISAFETRIAAVQVSRYITLHKMRRELGALFYNLLTKEGLMINNGYNPKESSFTKLFVYNPDFSTAKMLKRLYQNKVEAMHLEHKNGGPYQLKLITNGSLLIDLPVYNRVHDSIISLPLVERFKENDIRSIVQILKDVKNERE